MGKSKGRYDWRAIIDGADERLAAMQPAFKQARSRARGNQILTAAVRVFARDGIARARVADIAAEAGVPIPSIYDYYQSKDELAYAVPVQRQTEFFVEFGEAAKELHTSRERLSRFLWLTTDFARRHPDWARVLYLEIWPSVWVKEASVRHILDDYGRVIVGLIHEGAANGEWPTDVRAFRLATVFIGAINQIITTWLMYRRPRDLVRETKEMVADMMQLLDLPSVRAAAPTRRPAGAARPRPARARLSAAGASAGDDARGD